MGSAPQSEVAERLAEALRAEGPSDRLQAALTAGTHPDDSFLVPLLERCAVEPDFYVRDMLTWALTRLPRELTLPRLLAELDSEIAQARSQALHTLSKLGDPAAWPAITSEHLHDPDPEVARAAWRTAAALAPEEDREALAEEFARELGRGDLDVMRSLSRAFVELGEAAATSTLQQADGQGESPRARHARATMRLLADPESTFSLDG